MGKNTLMSLAALSAVCALGARSSATAGEIVADPFRAAAAVWPDHSVKGRDYWIMLQTPMFGLKGISDMDFVREAGVNDYVIRTRNEGGSRAISLSEVAAIGPDGRAVDVRADVTAVQDDVLIQGGEFLTDGRLDTFCVALGSRINPKTRYRGVTMRLDVRASSDVSELTLAASSDQTAWPGQVLCDSSAADISSTGGVWRVRFSSPVRKAELRVRSQPYRFVTLGIPANDPNRARFAAVPFCVYALDRGIWGIDPRQVDLTEANRIATDFPETYLGSDFSEWDGMLLYPLGRPASDRLKNLAAFGKIPCDRAGMRENFRTFFELAKSQKGPSLFAESANANFGLMACEWGSRQARLELTAAHPDCPHRNYIMYARGAARQFGVPLSFYMAYFRYSYTPNSRVTVTTGGENWGPDWGQEISLGRRQLYACYYSGGNYQSFEAMPWGQVKSTPQGLELTKNGESIREFYDWVRSGRGTRGAVYAPILLLTDRYAGHDQMSGERNHPVNGFGAYYGSYPPTAADFMTEYVLRAISPVGHPTPWNRFPADKMPNMKNSTLADIFDIHTANPDTPGRELRLDQLEKYPVAFLLDDIHWNESLANTVKRYVARGGTLVLTTAQTFPYSDDPTFLGATTNGVRTVDAGLVIDHVTVGAGAKVLDATASGLPLVIRQTFGRGAVILVTSPFYRKPSESLTPPPQVLALLERIQSDVLPFSFTGSCHVIPTVCGDGRWRILVMNNAGVVTPGNTGVDQVFPEYASTVSFRFPGGATVKEIRYGRAAACETLADGRLSATWTIPPGDLMVLEVSGLDLPIAGAVDADCPPVRPFAEQPYVAATPNDGYLFDPAKYVAPRKTPSMIGAWRRSDGWKDSSGENHPLRLDACRIDGEGLCCTGALSGAFVHMYNLKFDIHEATEETWATPSADDLKAKRDEMRYAIARGDQRTGPDFGIGVRNGRWCVYQAGGRGKPDRIMEGPVAEAKRTHLALVAKDGFVRAYVDGREVLSPGGPVRLGGDGQIRDSFHGHFSLMLGARTNLQPGPRFRGTFGDLFCHGRALSVSEIQERMKIK